MQQGACRNALYEIRGKDSRSEDNCVLGREIEHQADGRSRQILRAVCTMRGKGAKALLKQLALEQRRIQLSEFSAADERVTILAGDGRGRGRPIQLGGHVRCIVPLVCRSAWVGWGDCIAPVKVEIALAVPQMDRESVNSLSQSFGSRNAGIVRLFNRIVNKPVYFRRERAANAEMARTLAKCTLLAAVDFPIQVE